MLPEFEHRSKAMEKKYKSFVQDYKIYIESLKAAPKQGKSLLIIGTGSSIRKSEPMYLSPVILDRQYIIRQKYSIETNVE